METKITRHKNSTIEIEGEIPYAKLEKHKSSAIKKLGKDIKMAGFRKGKIPESIVEKSLDQQTLMEEMAEMALSEAYPIIFSEYKIAPLGKPHVTITKLAPGNPLGFKINTVVVPEVKLPDYKTIASKFPPAETKKIEATESEVEEAMGKIQLQFGEKDKKNDLTDEFVRKLGDFKNVADFKEKLKEQIKNTKKLRELEKKRIGIAEEIISKSEVDIPDILVESEIDKMTARFKSDVTKVGMKFEDYLKQIKKTEKDLRREWRPDAERQAKLQLVLNEIARKEKIKADNEKVDSELKHFLSHQKNVNKEMARVYIETILTNELVFQFLENQN